MRRQDLEREFATTLEPSTRVWRRGVDRAVRRFCGYSLSLVLPILVLSRTGDNKRQGELAELVGIEAPSLVRVLKQLEDEGLVSRAGGHADGRARTVLLTRQGVLLAKRLEVMLEEYRHEILGGIPEKELRSAIAVLHRIEAVVSGVDRREVPTGSAELAGAPAD